MKKDASVDLKELSAAIDKVSLIFTTEGWSSNRLPRHSAPHLMVRIFTKERAEPYNFFVVVFTQDSLDEWTGFETIRSDAETISSWQNYAEPIFLVLRKKGSDDFLWQEAHDHFDGRDLGKPDGLTIVFSDKRKIDRKFNNIVAFYCSERRNLLRSLEDSTEYLIQLIEVTYGIEIDFDPRGFLSMPVGYFVQSTEGLSASYLFGAMAEELGGFAAEMNADPVAHDKMIMDFFRELVKPDGESKFSRKEKTRYFDKLSTYLPNAPVQGESLAFKNYKKRKSRRP